jgi:CRISPR system Cascade subunit CasC
MKTMGPRFMQLHTLTSYPSALLNRDDAGFAKRIPFGGLTRTRISSQCLKRHWRTFDGEHSLREIGVPASIRSRLTFERYVVHPLIEDGIDADLARAVGTALVGEVLGKSAKAKRNEGAAKSHKEDDEEAERNGAGLKTEQVTVLGRPELDYLREVARAVCAGRPSPAKAAAAVKDRLGKNGRENLQALKHAAGLDAALFGRMVTSDILARGDAAIHVAHAFTVHAEATESDYFSAVDDLLQSGEAGDREELGSGHIGSTELTSGVYYGYVVIDLPLLVSNLEGCDRSDWQRADRSLAAGVVERVVHLVATVSPGAKLGSTAPYGRAHLVLAEAGPAQPRTLANAFVRGVREVPDVIENTYRALGAHLADLDRMYGRQFERKLSAMGPLDELCAAAGIDAAVPITELAGWVASQVRS